MANNARLTDPSLLLQAGIDPKTGLPVRFEDKLKNISKVDIKKQLRIVDEQNAINRYTWYNCPKGINGELIERILYYKGQGIFFMLQDKFFFLPYALSGEIDVYGRFQQVTPLPFNGTQRSANDKEAPWIQGLDFIPRYEIADIEEYLEKDEDEIRDAITKSCVILHDYTPQISQVNIPRQILQDPLLDVMSDCIPFMRTALLNSTGVMGIRVPDDDSYANVEAASAGINKAALEGRKYVGITGSLEFQTLTDGTTAKAEEFLLAMQSLDNYRLSLYGLDNGGLFQKKSHILQAEQEMNSGNVGLVAEDGLRNRQKACTIFNSYFGTTMWVEPSEVSLGADIDGDMVAGGEAHEYNETKVEEISYDE